MRVQVAGQNPVILGETETSPTIGITDYSVRTTDAYGVTTVVPRAFSRTLSVKLALPFDQVDAVQRTLADLRATSARWIVDPASTWLSPTGYFKEFSLDLPVPPLSYCTLTVEGLAETEAGADPGGDPAPDGQSSTLRLLQPITITDAMLSASSVPENDAAEWSAQTRYASGARVIRSSTHRIYENEKDGNTGDDPAAASPSGNWLDVGPTNRWAAFDQALGTATTAQTQIVLTLAPGAIDALAFLDLTAATVRVQATGYDRTQPAIGSVVFADLTKVAGPFTVTIAGAGQVSVGTVMAGALVALGVTGASPSAGIIDYSVKTPDAFGSFTIVQRAWAKSMTATALIRSDAIDVVAGRIASVRAQPCLWIGQDATDSLTVYGFFKDLSIAVGPSVSTLSLSIEGLSRAPQIAAVEKGIVWRDAWSATATYNQGDVVSYAGSSYIAGDDVPVGTIPTNTLYWDVFAAAGAAGATGIDGINPSLITLTASTGTIRYGTTGAVVPGQTVTFKAAIQNSKAVPVFTLLDWQGSQIFSGHPADYHSVQPQWTAPDAFTLGLTEAGFVAHMNAYGGTTGQFSIVAQIEGQPATASRVTIQKVQDGAAGAPGIPGTNGANGTPSYVHVAYANSADGSKDFVTGIANPGRIYIGIYTDASSAGSSDYRAYAWSRLTGSDGVNGTNGTPGPVGADGRQPYVHFAYADSADGSVNFTADAPGARRYIGVYSDYIEPDSTNPALYTWSLIKGADGAVGAPGMNGSNGSNGTNGGPGAPGANGADGLGSGNRIKWSQFEFGTSGWKVPYQNGGTQHDFRADSYLTKRYLGVRLDVNGGEVISLGNDTATYFPVRPGERLAVSMGLQAYGPVDRQSIAVFFVDQNGATTSGGTIWQNGGSRGYDTFVGGFANVPTGNGSTGLPAVAGRLEVYTYANGAGTLDIAIDQPMVCQASSNQTILPSFTPGNNAQDGATASSGMATFSAGFAAVLTVGLNAGATAQLSGAASLSRSNGGGNVSCGIQWSYSGYNSWNTLASDSEPVSPGEPATCTSIASLTNSSSTRRLYDFRYAYTGGSTANVTFDSANSFISAQVPS